MSKEQWGNGFYTGARSAKIDADNDLALRELDLRMTFGFILDRIEAQIRLMRCYAEHEPAYHKAMSDYTYTAVENTIEVACHTTIEYIRRSKDWLNITNNNQPVDKNKTAPKTAPQSLDADEK